MKQKPLSIPTATQPKQPNENIEDEDHPVESSPSAVDSSGFNSAVTDSYIPKANKKSSVSQPVGDINRVGNVQTEEAKEESKENESNGDLDIDKLTLVHLLQLLVNEMMAFKVPPPVMKELVDSAKSKYELVILEDDASELPESIHELDNRVN